MSCFCVLKGFKKNRKREGGGGGGKSAKKCLVVVFNTCFSHLNCLVEETTLESGSVRFQTSNTRGNKGLLSCFHQSGPSRAPQGQYPRPVIQISLSDSFLLRPQKNPIGCGSSFLVVCRHYLGYHLLSQSKMRTVTRAPRISPF